MPLQFAQSNEEFLWQNLDLYDQKAGAFIRFNGRVRSHNRCNEVAYLFYESYVMLAQNMFLELESIARDRFFLLQSEAIHRLGRVEVGQDAVAVLVLAQHRKEGFLGAQFLMDELKKTLPIWKKEVYVDGRYYFDEGHQGCH